MNLFGVMDVSGSALKAERVRAEVVAANMANAETTRTEEGGPYQRKHVVFAEQQGTGGFAHSLIGQMGGGLLPSETPDNVAGGVAVTGVVENQSAPLRRFDPQNPDAGADGYVAYPDIDPLTEMVDLMGATRAYGLNASAVQAEKGMMTASLELMK